MTANLDELCAAAIRFRDERDWAQFHSPKNLALGLSIEAAELAELFLWRTDAESRADLDEPEFRERLSHELADVLVYLLYLANDAGLDLAEAVRAKLALNAEKYPVERAKGSAKKYTELGDSPTRGGPDQ